jgi:antitoxin component YwqK of YwqJK toxin-antitoxin module
MEILKHSKYLFFLLIIIISVKLEAQQNKVDPINSYDQDSLRQGLWKFKHTKYYTLGAFKDDIQIEKWETTDKKGRLYSIQYFSQKGVLDSTIQFLKGKPFNGTCTQEEPPKDEFTFNKASGTCLDGRRDGVWNIRYWNGRINQQITYSNGIKNGLSIGIGMWGDTIYKVNFHNGILDGKVYLRNNCLEINYQYAENAMTCNGFTIGYYKQGLKDSIWQHYNFDNKLIIKTRFLNNLKNGEELIFSKYTLFIDTIGNIIPFDLYERDKVAKEVDTTFLWSKRHYKNGNPNLKWEIYDKKGNVISIRNFDNGKFEGRQQRFRNGNIIEEAIIKDEKLITYFHKDTSSYYSVNTEKFDNGNGKVIFQKYPLTRFFWLTGLIEIDEYNTLNTVFSDGSFTGFIELKNGKIIDGIYTFILGSGTKEFNVKFRNGIAKRK